ncbi:MAG TPA: glutamine amidotransferase [Xanthobacteraceae bacterium]|jgi:GMP synthase (glutamine-hydrolysing)|nr:glutamine amidotransferase [Xanthobacteraceae bacterium]
MTECLAIRHVAFEDAGLLSALLMERGRTLRTLDAGIDRFDPAQILSADLVVVLGGPIGVYEEDQYPFLHEEFAALHPRLEQKRPTLGICLGAQMIAKLLGAHVGPGPAKEIGWGGISLSETGRASVIAPLADVPVLHWHGDNADLPAGAVSLASTPVCPHQAFAVGDTILALQFHIEADPARIEQWLVGHTVELGKAGIDPREIRRQASEHGAATARAGRKILTAWFDQVMGHA